MGRTGLLQAPRTVARVATLGTKNSRRQDSKQNSVAQPQHTAFSRVQLDGSDGFAQVLDVILILLYGVTPCTPDMWEMSCTVLHSTARAVALIYAGS